MNNRPLYEEIVPARSFGLIESCGQGRTDIDQTDGDDEYYQDRVERIESPLFIGSAAVSSVNPVGQSRQRRGMFDLSKTGWDF